MRRIKFNRSCVELRSDLDRIAWDTNALADGKERLRDKERLVACLRVIVHFLKGSSEFY
jgi:hypothetical protein